VLVEQNTLSRDGDYGLVPALTFARPLESAEKRSFGRCRQMSRSHSTATETVVNIYPTDKLIQRAIGPK